MRLAELRAKKSRALRRGLKVYREETPRKGNQRSALNISNLVCDAAKRKALSGKPLQQKLQTQWGL
ncbi:hypothetical protein ATDW_17690 [Asticcacaulis sp. DW145]|uniref:hypothetical protein n=1 Tax=Asticcacaulis sp. DW145 TaxID=3095608 RepID=UPI0030912A5E|nr:hypothetical protein ATDW_17690 [Asticcacaulis sp. DW145]